MKSKRGMGFLLAAMGLFTLGLVGAAAYLILGGLDRGVEGTLHAYVQAPPVSVVGKDVIVVVTLQNNTTNYITIDEIRLPQTLLNAAPVASIVPGTLEHIEYPADSGYRIGFLMAPGDVHEFVITLRPEETRDVLGDITVIAAGGEVMAATGFRMAFEAPVIEAAAIETLAPPVEPTPEPVIEMVEPTAVPTEMRLPYAAVVKITARVKHSSYLRDVWTGSGSIVSTDGLVLTNAHLVSPGQDYRPDAWMVSITDDPAVAPTDMYFAEPLVVDEDLDLAVFHISSDLHYDPLDIEAENLTSVTLGDSSQLELGESLVIMGYPGIGGETITLTRGDVGGFTLSGQLAEPAFIKTSAVISGGTSGGMALDKDGHLVAIPTQLGYGQREGDLVDCRVIADTNLDGKINQYDVCVPVGGFINAMRPINLAKPLIEEAQRIIMAGPTPTESSPAVR